MQYKSTKKFTKELSKYLDSEDIQIIDEANSCVACHGPDGNSMVSTFPKIGGQYEDYLYHALKT